LASSKNNIINSTTQEMPSLTLSLEDIQQYSFPSIQINKDTRLTGEYLALLFKNNLTDCLRPNILSDQIKNNPLFVFKQTIVCFYTHFLSDGFTASSSV